jgi:hypothetical protein
MDQAYPDVKLVYTQNKYSQIPLIVISQVDVSARFQVVIQNVTLN